MSNARNPLSAIVFFAVLGGVIYLARHYGDGNPAESSRSQPIETDAAKNGLQFDGYDCTDDCSGHEAGYRWAGEHDIDDEEDCDTAGQRSNSPSFAEGCHAYVDGHAAPEEQDDNQANASEDFNDEN